MNAVVLYQKVCCWKARDKLGFDVPTTTAEIYTSH